MSEPMRDEVAVVLQGPTETIWDALQRNHSQLKAALSANREKDAEIARLKAVLSAQINFLQRLDELRSLDAELASLRASGGEKWIEIKEGCKMPEEDQDILYVVTGTDHNSPFVMRGLRGFVGDNWFWCDEDGFMDAAGNDGEASHVSHWMPLPAPPTLTREE